MMASHIKTVTDLEYIPGCAQVKAEYRMECFGLQTAHIKRHIPQCIF